MTTLKELVAAMAGRTRLQQETLLGTEVQIVGVLSGIDRDSLFLGQTDPPLGVSVSFRHSGERLSGQLLKYSEGDVARMTGRLWGFSSDPDFYHFDLLAIDRLYTNAERQKREEEEAERQRRESSSCFVATATYGLSNPAVRTLQDYRDRVLSRSAGGRLAVEVYYALSPAVAGFIAGSSRRRSISRVLLAPIVVFARWRLRVLP